MATRVPWVAHMDYPRDVVHPLLLEGRVLEVVSVDGVLSAIPRVAIIAEYRLSGIGDGSTYPVGCFAEPAQISLRQYDASTGRWIAEVST